MLTTFCKIRFKLRLKIVTNGFETTRAIKNVSGIVRESWFREKAFTTYFARIKIELSIAGRITYDKATYKAIKRKIIPVNCIQKVVMSNRGIFILI